MLLEGPCIGKLAGAAARRGNLTGSLRLLTTEENNCSLTPALALAGGGIDWLAQRSRAIAFAIAGKHDPFRTGWAGSRSSRDR